MSIRYLQTEISSLTSSRDSRSLISTFLSLFAEFGSLIISLKDDEIFTVTVPLTEKVTDIVLDAIEEMDELKIKLFDYIKNSNGVSRQEINDYMYPLFDTTDENELNNKTRYIINFLRERNLIHNKGTKNKPKWILKK